MAQALWMFEFIMLFVVYINKRILTYCKKKKIFIKMLSCIRRGHGQKPFVQHGVPTISNYKPNI